MICMISSTIYLAHYLSVFLPACLSALCTQVLLPRMTGSAVDGLKVQRALAELKDTLDILESMFLKRQPFLCGDDITLADLLAVCELMQVGARTRRP